MVSRCGTRSIRSPGTASVLQLHDDFVERLRTDIRRSLLAATGSENDLAVGDVALDVRFAAPRSTGIRLELSGDLVPVDLDHHVIELVLVQRFTLTGLEPQFPHSYAVVFEQQLRAHAFHTVWDRQTGDCSFGHAHGSSSRCGFSESAATSFRRCI